MLPVVQQKLMEDESLLIFRIISSVACNDDQVPDDKDVLRQSRGNMDCFLNCVIAKRKDLKIPHPASSSESCTGQEFYDL